ncbi:MULTISPECIES: phage holin family protein [unclassified Bradyrhizobium]|uniref:phage holin family protein n=1 Tax=unclassified Bradyrhizobium TaxID=2631580 RepID=UPI0028EB761B|nr:MULTISPECIES: phage holin family protein [unclassified Bradyrhizobium]
MLAPPGELLQLGLEQRLNRVKRATQAYMRDRARQATGTVTSYAVAAGLFATAGIFLIAACIVGLTALFRWVEMSYGLFTAFAVVGGILVALAVISAVVAAVKLRSPTPHYPSLSSRLRVAIAAPVARQPDADEIDPDTIPLAPSAASTNHARGLGRVNVPVGVAVAALLLGVAALRRRRHHQT